MAGKQNFRVWSGYESPHSRPENRCYLGETTPVGRPFPTRDEAEAEAQRLQAAEQHPVHYYVLPSCC